MKRRAARAREEVDRFNAATDLQRRATAYARAAASGATEEQMTQEGIEDLRRSTNASMRLVAAGVATAGSGVVLFCIGIGISQMSSPAARAIGTWIWELSFIPDAVGLSFIATGAARGCSPPSFSLARKFGPASHTTQRPSTDSRDGARYGLAIAPGETNRTVRNCGRPDATFSRCFPIARTRAQPTGNVRLIEAPCLTALCG